MTPPGQEQRANVTMRFSDLRARVTRQVDTVRHNDMQVKALDCPVHVCFRRDGTGVALITQSDVLLMDKVRD